MALQIFAITDERVLFLNVRHGREVLHNNSWCNNKEARVVAKLVKRLVEVLATLCVCAVCSGN